MTAEAANRGVDDVALGGREAWIDMARGSAILLIVLGHAVQFMGSTRWDTSSTEGFFFALRTYPVPVFFILSGMLGSRIVRESDFRTVLSRRVLPFLYLYFAWCAVRTVWFSVVEWPLSDLNPVSSFLRSPFIPWEGMWFLYAMAGYYVLAWLMRSLPTIVQIGLALVVSFLFITSTVQITHHFSWRSIGACYLFFLIGVLLKDRIVQWAATIRYPLIWIAGSLLVYGTAVVVIADVSREMGYRLLVPSAIVAGVAGFALWPFVARFSPNLLWLGSIGRHTLPIYLMNTLWISILVQVVPDEISLWPAALIITAGTCALAGVVFAVLGRVPGVFSPIWARQPSGG